jgi:hypothetical protein
MTSTNVNQLQNAVSAFQSLDIDDKLAVLALVYTEKANEIPSNAGDALPTQKAADLVARVQQLSPEEQLFALRDILPAERTDQNETMLDPHPSKAMVELAQGGTEVPTGEYGSMNAEAKIAFWYLVAQRLGSNIIGIPSDYQPSQQAKQVATMLKSLNTDDLVAFLKQVL